MNGPLAALARREFAVARASGAGGAVGVSFYFALVVLAPFAIGPDRAVLARVAPALLWLGALLSTLLGLDRLFQADAEDGALDQMTLAKTPLEAIALVKGAVHWLVAVLPLVVVSPAFGLMLGLEPANLPRAVVALLAGTPAITAFGAIGAALTASLRRAGPLTAVLVAPMAVPTLIFGVEAANAASVAPFPAMIAALAGISLAAVALAPFAAAAALRAARG